MIRSGKRTGSFRKQDGVFRLTLSVGLRLGNRVMASGGGLPAGHIDRLQHDWRNSVQVNRRYTLFTTEDAYI